MKKLLSTLFGSTLIAGLLFGFIYFSDQARAYEPPLPDTSPELAILVVLPPEFTPAGITSSLFCSRLEVRTSSLALLSLWAKTSDGLTFAHLQVTGDKATGFNMLFIGPKAFFIILKDIIGKLEPRGERRDILPTGPVDLASIAKLDAKVCNAIASSLLIRIVEKVEEKPGTVASVGPGEAGAWPEAEIITCADGVRWERRTLMNGHPLATMSWTKEPTTAEAAKELPEIKLPELLPCSAPAFAWEVPAPPPTPTTKQCTIPISQECPK
jgi:hypothetical protein